MSTLNNNNIKMRGRRRCLLSSGDETDSLKMEMMRMEETSQLVIQKMNEFFNREKGENEEKVVVSGSSKGGLRTGMLSDSYKMVLKVGTEKDTEEEERDSESMYFDEYHLHIKIRTVNDAK